MIGTGVFTTSGFALADLGSPSLVMLAWGLGALLAMCGALSYAGLARRMPESGGEYYFLSRTLHPMAGFLAGWVSLFAGFSAPIAVSAVALSGYLTPVFEAAGGYALDAKWTGTLAITLAFCMHGLRRSGGVRAQNVVVATKVVLLLVFLVFGAYYLSTSTVVRPPAPSKPFELGAFAVTLVWISFSFSGWNATCYLAREVENPKRNAPLSLVIGCALVAVLYLGLNTVFVYGAPLEALMGQPDVGRIAAKTLGGVSFERFTSLIVALALFTSITSMIMAGPRVYAVMAEDGLFPACFKFTGSTPRSAVFLQSLLAIAVLWTGDLVQLLGYIGFTLGISSAVSVLGLLRLRRREGRGKVWIPGFPVVPYIYVFVTLGSALYLVMRRPTEALWGLGTLAVGALVYIGANRTRLAS
jgi:amino acid transporter